MEDWQRKVAIVFLNSGGKRFLTALSHSIANGIPYLAQSSLFTVAWMSRILLSDGNANFQYVADSILSPGLPESTNYDRAFDERVLPSFSLQRLIKSSGIRYSFTLFRNNDLTFQVIERDFCFPLS